MGASDGTDGFHRAEIERVMRRWSLSFDAQEADEFLAALDNVRGSYAAVSALAAAQLPPVQARAPDGLRQGRDRYNAWRWQFEPLSAGEGSLSGQRLAIKDCIAVAGVPMTVGGRLLREYVPTADAVVVERARAAGASIAGTATCEDLCCSGSSFTSVTGPVRNPYDPTRSAGGSSSGCAVLVATGEADLALGTDQGGSVRNPAAWSGVCGLKPSYGLVPYAGAFPFEFTLDHVGLIARCAADVAALLEVIAGPSDQDARQAGVPAPAGYSLAGSDAAGLRIGVVQEGFGWPEVSELAQDRIVQAAVEQLRALGAHIAPVSIPLHRYAKDIHVPIATEGSLATVFEQGSQGSNRLGTYDAELASAVGRAIRANPDDIPLNAKLSLVAGSVLRAKTGGAVLARAQSLRRLLRQQYDQALATHDVLVMPATPMRPHTLPTARLAAAQHNRLSFDMHRNNCAQNLTGHPALSVPCGLLDGLPVGMLLIGRHFDERTLLRTAHQYQSEIYPAPMPPTVAAGTDMAGWLPQG